VRRVQGQPVQRPACSQGCRVRHGGDELVGGQRSHACDAGQDLVPTGECCIGSDKSGDLGVERFDTSVDLFKPLPTLALEQSDGEVFLAVLERRAITHQPVAGIDELCHLNLLRAGLIAGCRVAAMRASSMASM